LKNSSEGDDINQALAGVIREKRVSAGLTQVGLSELAGVHPIYISQLERGLKSPTVRVLERIAMAVGTTSYRLLEAAHERRTR
jgi:transcriptional regulator with XRE-family HTH domain